ncbi:MAG: phytoene/squalene synthase family protein [Planctomycetota bacterium]|nr:phytoene/squalene synthase family protein [Planctomycetota bacterium]
MQNSKCRIGDLHFRTPHASRLTPHAASLEDSYAQCVELTRTRARNFHFAFSILPKDRYRAICALYAFTRTADDFSDDEADPRKALAASQAWRAAFERAMAGDFSAAARRGAGERHCILPAVADAMHRYKIPPQYMHDLITGTEMDARQARYETWEDTYRYCYHVASVIGMMTIHVFGFEDKRAIPLAEKTGIAFQMTNILRDLAEDARRSRIYLPLEDLRAHGVSEAAVLAVKDSPAMRRLVKFETERAKTYYAAGRELVPLIAAESRDALGSLVAIYQRLLEEIERRDYDVLSRRVSLSKAEKLRLAAGFAWKKFLRIGS